MKSSVRTRPPAALGALLSLLAATAALTACGTIIGVDERHGGDPDASTSGATEAGAETETDADGGGAETGDGAAPPLTPQTLGQFVDPVLAMGESDLLVLDRTATRSTLTRISKSAPTKTTKIYDEPAASASTRLSTVGIARGQVWFTTSDGKLRRMGMDGNNPTVVDNAPSSILARSANTLWTAAPDYLSSAPTLRWIGGDLLSQVPEATLSFGGPAMFAFGSDDELVFSSRTANGQWTLNRWRPFAAQPLLPLATFDAYPSWIAADAQRVLVYGQDEGTIVSWSRMTPQISPTTVLVAVPAPVSIATDGQNMLLRSQTSVSSCVIASCASTMRVLKVPTTFTKARYLAIDEQWAYFFHAKSDTGPMTLVRVPR